jgi:hypothetical protein
MYAFGSFVFKTLEYRLLEHECPIVTLYNLLALVTTQCVAYIKWEEADKIEISRPFSYHKVPLERRGSLQMKEAN